jgi:hypothetical protein
VDERTSLHAYFDIVGYSRLNVRQHEDRQKLLVWLINGGLEQARVRRDQVIYGDQGDARMLTFPDGVSVSRVLDVMPRWFNDALTAFNRDKAPYARMRVRIAFAMGPSAPGVIGQLGYGPIAASRLSDAGPLKDALEAEPDANVGVIIDDSLYRQHVAQPSHRDLKKDEYRQEFVSYKGFEEFGWIRLVGYPASALPGQGRAAATFRRSAEAGSAAAPGRTHRASGAAGAIGGKSARRRRIRLTTAWATLIVGVISAAVTLGIHLADGGAGAGPRTEPPAPGRSTSKASHSAVASPPRAPAAQATVPLPQGFFPLRRIETGDCLDSTHAGYVFTNACNGGEGQKWIGLPASGATYALENELTGSCLTASTLTASTQTGIQSAACDTSDPHQQWRWQTNGSDVLTSLVHVSDGSCLAEEPTSDHPTTVECDGRSHQDWHAG